MKKCGLLTNFKNFRPFCLHLPWIYPSFSRHDITKTLDFCAYFAIIAVDSILALLVEILGHRVSQAPVRGYPS